MWLIGVYVGIHTWLLSRVGSPTVVTGNNINKQASKRMNEQFNGPRATENNIILWTVHKTMTIAAMAVNHKSNWLSSLLSFVIMFG